MAIWLALCKVTVSSRNNFSRHRGIRELIDPVNCSPFLLQNCSSSPSCIDAQCPTPLSHRTLVPINTFGGSRCKVLVKSLQHYFHCRYLCCRTFDGIVKRIVNHQQFRATKCLQRCNILCVTLFGATRGQ